MDTSSFRVPVDKGDFLSSLSSFNLLFPHKRESSRFCLPPVIISVLGTTVKGLCNPFLLFFSPSCRSNFFSLNS